MQFEDRNAETKVQMDYRRTRHVEAGLCLIFHPKPIEKPLWELIVGGLCEKLINLSDQISLKVFRLTDAYILAKLEAGQDQEVLNIVRKMAGVKNATPTYGIYDLLVEVSFNRMEDLDKFMFDGIRRIRGVKETATLIAPKKVM